MSALRLLTVSLLVPVLTSGCGGGYVAPIEEVAYETPEPPASVVRPSADAQRPAGEHVIRPGDTLYSIAFRYGLDYQQLARWNGITPPYTIYVGRRLKLAAPPVTGRTPAPAATTASRPAENSNQRRTPDAQPPARTAGKPVANDAQRNAPSASTGTPGIRWQWPARGRVETADSVLGQRGINIVGTRGQPVVAAANGEVVYSGSGLVGYGKLIIIKHNDTYLSAYAHNDKLLVAEGAKVAGGQQIAEMGSTGTRQVMLHFEIRRGGKPVPPLQFLP